MYELLIPRVRPPAPRYKISAQARLVSRTSDVLVEVHDISTEGLKLATDLPLAVGESVLVRLPDGNAAHATVRWINSGFVGVRFATDLSEADVTKIVEG